MKNIIQKMKSGLPYFSRVVVGALFMAAAISKAMIFPEVTREIIGYKLIPELLAAPGTWLLILGELTIGVFLLVGYRMKQSTYAAIGLLALFFLVKVSAVVRGLPPCSVCFGTLWVLPLWGIFAVNAGMTGLLLLILKYGKFETREELNYAEDIVQL